MFPDKEQNSGKTSTTRSCTNLNWIILSSPLLWRMFQNLKSKRILELISLVSRKTKFFPLYLSKVKTEKIIPLFLFTDWALSHFCWITNFHASMARQFGTRNHNWYKYFKRCLHGISNSKAFEEHLDLFGEHRAVHITMPREDSKIEFTNWHKQ